MKIKLKDFEKNKSINIIYLAVYKLKSSIFPIYHTSIVFNNKEYTFSCSNGFSQSELFMFAYHNEYFEFKYFIPLIKIDDSSIQIVYKYLNYLTDNINSSYYNIFAFNCNFVASNVVNKIYEELLKQSKAPIRINKIPKKINRLAEMGYYVFKKIYSNLKLKTKKKILLRLDIDIYDEYEIENYHNFVKQIRKDLRSQ
ncbi:hypothetical protein BMW23_0940 [Bodo saltans virus]|uniref:PPPDE domain-containing protein n=1 Tax=Bodo saltans virus TaxID=2024608 RepID=A0A2H4UVX2_9VIRU|nr:hypothetical protein QJ851_gp0922 [Bodo saltans virus]ATZ80985.1 hypothetical protein BMW23_0940 [Bodo saltans virus]